MAVNWSNNRAPEERGHCAKVRGLQAPTSHVAVLYPDLTGGGIKMWICSHGTGHTDHHQGEPDLFLCHSCPGRWCGRPSMRAAPAASGWQVYAVCWEQYYGSCNPPCWSLGRWFWERFLTRLGKKKSVRLAARQLNAFRRVSEMGIKPMNSAAWRAGAPPTGMCRHRRATAAPCQNSADAFRPAAKNAGWRKKEVFVPQVCRRFSMEVS